MARWAPLSAGCSGRGGGGSGDDDDEEEEGEAPSQRRLQPLLLGPRDCTEEGGRRRCRPSPAGGAALTTPTATAVKYTCFYI